MRQGDTHGSGFVAIRGVPLPNQQRKIGDGPVRVKGTTIGWAVWIIMNHWGVSSCCTNPPVSKAEHRNDIHTEGVLSNRNPAHRTLPDRMG